jgi:hypothetical protein
VTTLCCSIRWTLKPNAVTARVVLHRLITLSPPQAVLRGWKQDVELADAGLFHSIYGTEGFAGFALPFTERPTIRALVGQRAERLGEGEP